VEQQDSSVVLLDVLSCLLAVMLLAASFNVLPSPVGESASSGASSSVEAGLNLCVSIVGSGERSAPFTPGVAASPATPPLMVRRGIPPDADWLVVA